MLPLFTLASDLLHMSNMQRSQPAKMLTDYNIGGGAFFYCYTCVAVQVYVCIIPLLNTSCSIV